MTAFGKIASFFKNKWTKIGFSALSLGYFFFMLWLAWLTFTFHLVPTNPVSLFSLYLLINVLFGTVMIYTRKQVATQITACLLHPCILVMLVFAFGDLYLLIPVFAMATIVFFAAGTPESLKTILGTVYLILFVLTVLGYLTLQIFAITRDMFPVNLELRSETYIYSSDGSYRLVMYIDKEDKENRTVAFHAEFTGNDMTLPFLDCERYAGSTEVYRQRLPRDFEVERVSNYMLVIKEFETDADTGRRMPAGEKEVEWLTADKILIDEHVFTAPDFTRPIVEGVEENEGWFSGETVPFDVSPGEITRWEPPVADPIPEPAEE
ncbi:MAG: hypothetical protein LBC86_10510 [Oscillospiraceae bacterium]|jgi:hypothetical protein|nr:hypothetical protein [Oscillospiraceae bacterium]